MNWETHNYLQQAAFAIPLLLAALVATKVVGGIVKVVGWTALIVGVYLVSAQLDIWHMTWIDESLQQSAGLLENAARRGIAYLVG